MKAIKSSLLLALALLGIGALLYAAAPEPQVVVPAKAKVRTPAAPAAPAVKAKVRTPAAPAGQPKIQAPAAPVLIEPTGLTARKSTDTLSHPDSLVRAALVYIENNLDRSFGAPEIAKATGIPRHRLDHLFAKKIGRSVGAEIYARRVAKAQRLLGDPSLAVKTVAKECGFCNIAYLSNVFRRETGLSPRAWRAAARKNGKPA